MTLSLSGVNAGQFGIGFDVTKAIVCTGFTSLAGLIVSSGGITITGNSTITGTLSTSGLTCTTLVGTSGSTYGGWQTYNASNGTLFGTSSSNNYMGIGSGAAFTSANVFIRCVGGASGFISCLSYSGLGCTLSAGGSNFASSSDERLKNCLLYTSPSPRDRTRSRMPSSA